MKRQIVDLQGAAVAQSDGGAQSSGAFALSGVTSGLAAGSARVWPVSPEGNFHN
jgi:hypothetical protein